MRKLLKHHSISFKRIFRTTLGGGIPVLFVLGLFTFMAGGSMASKNQSKRYYVGWEHLRQLDESAANRVQESLKEISPELGRYIVEFAYGDVYSRPGLDIKSRQIATTAALAAMGTASDQLKFHIGAALNVGCTPDEITDVFYLISVFSGFPAALNGIKAAETVYKERKIKITQTNQTDQKGQSRRERGLSTLSRTSSASGKTVIEGLNESAPDLASFIIDFAYGDIISRTVLDPKHKAIAIISACVAMGTAKPQLKVHIHAALNVGCTKEQIKETIIQMAVYAGFPSSLNAMTIANTVFKENSI